jgi:hypothetical protein
MSTGQPAVKRVRGAVDGDNVLILLILSLSALLVLVVLWGNGVIRFGGGEDAARTEVEARVQQFAQDASSQAFGRVASQVHVRAGHPDNQSFTEHMRRNHQLMGLRAISIESYQRSGDTAAVSLTATVEEGTLPGEIRLVRQGGRWWISEFYLDGRPLLRPG